MKWEIDVLKLLTSGIFMRKDNAKQKKLIKNHKGAIVLYIKHKENTHITTSAVIAAHVSSGSVQCYNDKSGYRHINFITVKGSLYYGSGITNDHKTKKLLEKLLIMTSG